MKGYKAFNSDWTCRDFKYEVGKTYDHEGEIVLCRSGFHFCQSLSTVIDYYPLNPTIHFCEVEALGYVIAGDGKFVTNKIKIIKEISFNDVLVKLSEDENKFIRYTVAKNNNTPIDILIKLSKDENECIRCAVAGNNNTPIDVLTKLSEDKDQYVRYAVARNNSTPIGILTKLSKDKNWCVKLAAMRVNRIS